MHLRSVWNQNLNSAGRYWHKRNIFDMNFKKKSKCPEPTIWWYWSADTLFWELSIDDNIDVQSASSWAPKVARKCESKHRYACGADRRSLSRSVTRLPNFLGWVDYLSYGASCACGALLLLSWDICCGFNNHQAIVEPRRVKYSMWSWFL